MLPKKNIIHDNFKTMVRQALFRRTFTMGDTIIRGSS
jgi:hypothetical protein